jgi:hypothetical protein
LKIFIAQVPDGQPALDVLVLLDDDFFQGRCVARQFSHIFRFLKKVMRYGEV